ncbi:MAG: hypothetical protein ACR2LV_06685 [Solirubrobacteraceae bacterium]
MRSTSTSTSSIRRRPVAVGLICVALVAGLSACGSSSSSTGASGGSTGGGAATSGARAQARLNLAKCFRSHGVNVPDPSTGGGPAGGGGIFRTLRNYPRAQVTSAEQSCRQYLVQAFPRLNETPAQRAQRQAQLVKFAECMRSHGVNVPDPSTGSTGGTGGGFGFGRGFRSIDHNSPSFKAANTACASLRPRFGRGGGGGGGGGGAGG